MTKTIKKGLVAFLVVLMAVLVGITASAWGVNAEEAKSKTPQEIADDFIMYVGQFGDETLTDDTAWTESEAHKKLWESYNQAKLIVGDIQRFVSAGTLSADYSTLKDARSKFDKVEAIYGKVYDDYVSEILSAMNNIANGGSFDEKGVHIEGVNYKQGVDRVAKLGEQLGLTGSSKEVQDKWVPFIKTLTNDYEMYYRADAFLKKIANIFKDVENAISGIYYYDAVNRVMGPKSTEENRYYIVLDSENYEGHGVADAEAIINKYTSDYRTKGNVDYTVALDSGANATVAGKTFTARKVFIAIEGGFDQVKGYDELTAARDTIDNYKKMAADLVKNIHAVYDMVDEGSKYYTVKDLIDAADKTYASFNSYKLLSDESAKTAYKFNGNADPAKGSIDLAAIDKDNPDTKNYNDLQKLVDGALLAAGALPEGAGECPNPEDHATKKAGMTEETVQPTDPQGQSTIVKGALKEMVDYIDGLTNLNDGKIIVVEKALAELKKDTPKYNDAYKKLINAADEAYKDAADGLDNDIKAWDRDLYYEKNPDKAPKDYNATPDAYYDEFPEFDGGENGAKLYIVDGYEEYMAALDQWAEWEAQIENIVEKLRNLVDLYQTIEEVVDDNGDPVLDAKGNPVKRHPEISTQFAEIDKLYNELTDEQKEALDLAAKPDGKIKGIDDDDDDIDESIKIEIDENKFTIKENGEIVHLANGKNTPGDVYDEFNRILNAIYSEVKILNNGIKELYEKTVNKGVCVFQYRTDLLKYQSDYEALSEEKKAYISYTGWLNEMLDEYNEELPIVLAWKEAARGLGEFYTGNITVNNWTKIQDAIAAFNELFHKDKEGNKETLAQGQPLSMLQKAVSNDTAEFEKAKEIADKIIADETKFKTLADIYVVYEAKAKEYNDLVAAIEALVRQMASLKDNESLNIKDFANPTAWTANEWANTVRAAKKALDALKGNEVTLGWLKGEEKNTPAADKADEYKEAAENFERAWKLYNQYNTEHLINLIYQEDKYEEKTAKNPEGYETDVKILRDGNLENGEITLADARKIQDAEDAEAVYVECGGTDEDLRNFSKLQAARAALDEITKDLYAYMLRVANLALAERGEDKLLGADATSQEIEAAIKDLLKANGYEGYMLNITDPMPVDQDTLAKLLAEYNDVIAKETAKGAANGEAAKDFLEDTLALLNLMDELGNVGHEASDGDAYVEANVITKLNKDIETLLTKVEGQDGDPNADDLDKVYDIMSRYQRLHASQQKHIRDYNKIQAIADTRAAQQALQEMLRELYEEVVTNGEVTNYSTFYLDTIISIYDTFNETIKKTFTLNDGKMTFEAAIEAIRARIQAAEEAGTVLSLSGVSAAMDGMYDELVAAFNNAFSDVSGNALGDGFADAIKEFKENIEKTITQKVGDLEKKLQAQIDDLNNKVKDLQTALDALTADHDSDIAALQSQLEALNKAIEDAKNDLTAINELRSDMEKADSAIGARVDSVNASITTLTVLLIIIGVLLVAAIVCVVILFIKRK